jgi:hypothetical protein
MRRLDTIQGCPIWQEEPSAGKAGRGFFRADGDVDADGCNGQAGKWAYMPGDKGLELLANAGYPKFPASYRSILVCGADGKPTVINGGYVSRTAYEWSKKWPDWHPERYVDAYTVPYVCLPPSVRLRARGVVLGCMARVTNTLNDKSVVCVVADIGPASKIGEISMAAARAIGLEWNPRAGGTSARILDYEFWPDVPAEVNGVTYDLQRAA